MKTKTTLVEMYRPSKRALDWLAKNMSFGMALEGIAAGELYYVMKLRPRAIEKRAKKARKR